VWLLSQHLGSVVSALTINAALALHPCLSVAALSTTYVVVHRRKTVVHSGTWYNANYLAVHVCTTEHCSA